MDIDRKALLLYLRDLRDLEIAKMRINELYNQEKMYVENQLAYLKTPNLIKENYEVKTEGSLVCTLVGAVIGLFFGILGISIESGAFTDFIKFICLAIAFFGGIIFVIGLIGAVSETKDISEKNKKASEYNKQEKERVRNSANDAEIIERKWEQRSAYLTSEYNTVDSLLTDYYDQNILAKQYRTLPALIYIYDYMSTSQESFRDTLIHEHMEDGIQKILNKLDLIIQQNEEIIFRQHRIEAQNSKMISQNREMLGTLERTEQNTISSEQYARLSANYSRVSAYFSAATYLEKQNTR